MREHYPIQLADIISWAHTKRLMRQKHGDKVKESWRELSRVAEQVIPFTRRDFSARQLEELAFYGGVIPERVEEEFSD